MIDKELMVSKMADIQKYYGELEPILKNEARQIIEDNLQLHTLERLFQLIVDASIDINTHIISELSISAPNDYQGTFVTFTPLLSKDLMIFQNSGCF